MINESDLVGFDYYDNDAGITLNNPPPNITHFVQEFAAILGQLPDPNLYVRLVEEEVEEWIGAIGAENDLKELADLVYVCFGYANACGYDLNQALVRVHKNNIGRCVQPDGTIKRRGDGKIMKNPNYPKVDLNDLV